MIETCKLVVARVILGTCLRLEPDPGILRRWVPYWLVWNCARKR